MSCSPVRAYNTETRVQLAAVSEARGGCNVLFCYFPDGEYLGDKDAEEFERVIERINLKNRDEEFVFILEIQGGAEMATLKIITALQCKFNNVTAVVHSQAISAGTLIALSCKRLIISKEAEISQTDPMHKENYLAAKELLLARDGHEGRRTVNGQTFAKDLCKRHRSARKLRDSRKEQECFLKKAGRSPREIKEMLNFFYDDPDHKHSCRYTYEKLKAEIKNSPWLELLDDEPELYKAVDDVARTLTEFAYSDNDSDREAFKKHKHFFVHIAR